MKFIINLFVICVLFFSGCAQTAKNIGNQIDYEVQNVELDLNHNIADGLLSLLAGKLPNPTAKITATLKITNKNNIDLRTSDLNYEIFANEVKIGSGKISKMIEIKAKESQVIQIPVFLDVSKTIKTAYENKSAKKHIIKIKGSGKFLSAFGIHDFEFEKSKQID